MPLWHPERKYAFDKIGELQNGAQVQTVLVVQVQGHGVTKVQTVLVVQLQGHGVAKAVAITQPQTVAMAPVGMVNPVWR